MKKQLIYSLIMGCILFQLSCNKNDKRTEAEKMVTEWMGKTIQLPKNISCTTMGKDTICPGLFDADYKILAYVDSTGCTSCKLRLLEWKDLITETDTIASKKISYLFYFQPKDKKSFFISLKANDFSYPVFVDKENNIHKLNAFPEQPEFHVFLLNKKNSVLAIGNPITNPKVKDLYKKIITEEND